MRAQTIGKLILHFQLLIPISGRKLKFKQKVLQPILIIFQTISSANSRCNFGSINVWTSLIADIW